MNNWINLPGSLSYPRNWQQPARTEEWVFETYRADLKNAGFAQLVHFPWASLIDALRKNSTNKSSALLDALMHCPPRSKLLRATVCQHIYALDMLEWFQRIGITDLYWSHAVIDQSEIEGIRIHPFPLFPVRVLEPSALALTQHTPLSQRGYLYSFIGTFTPDLYLSDVGQWIFDLPPRSDALVVSRTEWHYEKNVYQEQIQGNQVSVEDRRLQKKHGDEFSEVMADSIFCLCPSGSGPNSIRLWESLGFGCIPVLLADTLRLPGDQDLWKRAIVRVAETEEAVAALPALLDSLRSQPEKLLEMQQACRQLWKLYGLNGPVTVLSELADRKVIRERVMS